MKVNFIEFLDWSKQSSNDAGKWYMANGISKDRVDDFKAGFEKGFIGALQTLRLHKLIEIDDRCK